MGSFTVGQVVLLPFPFSDLSRSKYRPAAILADSGRGDWVLCQITSNPYADLLAVALDEEAFISGGLHRVSYARPGKLFTANESIFAGTAGQLSPFTVIAVVEQIIRLLRPKETDGTMASQRE
ncbi:MAG: MazF family transcriptional regulator [Magnetococcales bacterium]|nr:MazF family transcriptional regulator [Magnetococcales bacterium]